VDLRTTPELVEREKTTDESFTTIWSTIEPDITVKSMPLTVIVVSASKVSSSAARTEKGKSSKDKHIVRIFFINQFAKISFA